MTPDRQDPLPFWDRPALGREDYFVSEANALTTTLVENWRQWVNRKLLLVGPEASGKTHLAHVWAERTEARIITAAQLTKDAVPDLAQGPCCVEDVQDIANQHPLEEALFHLHNLSLSNAQPMLYTARVNATAMNLTLPDLRSRMQAVQSATLSEPDDALLSALLAKQFTDRGTTPPADVIPYLARHMPRSFAAVSRVVDALDAAATGRSGGLSRPLAINVLKRLAQTGDDTF